jgi:O-methyltransferase
MNTINLATRAYAKAWLNYLKYKKIYSRYKQHTMVTEREYVDFMALVARFKNIPGAVIECGVWRGGSIAGMADLLGNERSYYLFDSFEGLPPAKEIDGIEAIKYQEEANSPHYHDNCTAEESWAIKAMEKSAAEKYYLKKGWFENTVPQFELNESIAVLRLDGDWYESTMTCLTHLFPKVQPGGLIILDDYYVWEGCSKALHDYLSMHKRTERITRAYTAGCYLVKKEE